MNRVLRLCSLETAIARRNIHTTSNSSYFYESRKSGYTPRLDRPPEPPTGIIERFNQGCSVIKTEIKKYIEETKIDFSKERMINIPSKEYIFWKFDGEPKRRDEWILTCDSDNNEGFSTASLEISPRGTGIFSGELITTAPKDGRIRRTGYCNITTAPKRKSFMRLDKLDWSMFNHIVLRVRGDGRCYMLNILTKDIYDMTWNDMYHYPLHTRGGPYWQHVKIPFSRFLFGTKGGIQDKQYVPDFEEVSNFGITIADNITGHFKLEIDYIGVVYEHHHFEESAYESYDVRDIKH